MLYNAYSNEAAVKAANHHDVINDDLFFAGLTAAEPEALRELWPERRWAAHKNKIPFNPLSGVNAKSNDHRTCVTFSEANAALDEYDGVEYLIGEGICGIDLDHCIDPETGKVNVEALRIVDMLDSYAELSPSGTGIHILIRGEMPFTGRQGSRDAALQIEMYSEYRFLTITGIAINDLPIADRTKEIKELADQYFPSTGPNKEPGTASVPLDPDNSQKIILSALDAIDPADCDYMQWIRIGVGLKEAGLGADIWDEWSRRDPDRYKPGECSKKWDTFKEPGQNSNGSGIIIELAKENGWRIGDSFNEDEKEDYFRNKALSELQQMQHVSQVPETLKTKDAASKNRKRNAEATPCNDRIRLIDCIIPGAELMSKDLKEPEFFIKGLLPVGGTILAGPPKIGKSFLSMSLGASVQNGEKFLDLDTNAAHVLILALEDSEYRLQKRYGMQGHSGSIPDFAILSPSYDDGLLDDLREVFETYGRTLVIIDTLQRIRPEDKPGKTEYKMDYPFLTEISALARDYGSAVLLIHHTRKTVDENNPFNMINGSVGLQGAVDAMMVITRNKQQTKDHKATLHVTGRDIGMDEIEMVFMQPNVTWMRASSVEDNSRHEFYENDPVISTLRIIMEEIKVNDAIADNTYITTAQEFLNRVICDTGECSEMSARECIGTVMSYADLLSEDGISIIKPIKSERINGIPGRYYRFRKA